MSVTAGWESFFVATAGASAALVGLIIVAISASIHAILKYAPLPSRAAAAISSLTLLLVIACFALFPHQSDVALGCEFAVAALLALVPQIFMVMRLLQQRPKRPAFENAYKMVLGLGQFVPFYVGSVLVATSTTAGMYWIASGFVVVFIASMVTVWVLLVEIQR